MKEDYIKVDFTKLAEKYGFSEHTTSPDEIRAFKIALCITLPTIILIGILIF